MITRNDLIRAGNNVMQALVAAVGRLDKSLSPADTIARLRAHHFTIGDLQYVPLFIMAVIALYVMEVPGFPLKLGIPILYTTALLIPLTSQFFLPATPIFSWLLTFYSSRFIPPDYRPTVSVVLLPTLESVLYGANISDILTRFTHPILDILGWLSYGVGHFSIPFVVAAFIWLFRPKEVLHLWALAFGYLNLVGVLVQIIVPCAAPWYELVYGLVPANYAMKGSPGGLARIDKLFHSSGYTNAFSNAPLIFGAFPSLHAGCATMEALFLSHFFPHTTRYIWTYAGVLYWATMYLTHHYLIDVVAGACLSTATFYLFLPDELRTAPYTGGSPVAGGPNGNARNKYEIYDLEAPARKGGRGRLVADAADFELSDASSDEEEMDITYRSPMPSGTAPAPYNTSDAPGTPVKSVRKAGHRHTASIASLIRGEDRSAEEGWSPLATPTRATAER